MISNKKKSERGASLVEFALVAPLFFLLVFALIEGSALFFARNTIGLAAADASRSGSIDSFAAGADAEMVNIIVDRADATFGASIQRIVIYEAQNDTSQPSDSCRNGLPDGTCAVYNPSDFTGPGCSGGWCAGVQDHRQADDLLGIWVLASYDGMTGLNPFNVDWTEQRFALLEPEL